MQRTLIKKTPFLVDQSVLLKGWVNTIRAHGGIVFIDIRDRSGLVQIVATTDLVKNIKEEYVLEIEGLVKKRPDKMINPNLDTGTVEVEAKTIKILSTAEPLPFDIKEGMNLSLPVLLDYRSLALRNEKNRAIFKIEETVIDSFRTTLKGLDFTEIQVPTIVPTATEGGAEVFKIDYYNRTAYLGQSPQLYKQMLVGVFERVYTLAHAYRAEPSITTRHLSEYIGLDAEMGFIDSWKDLMDTCETIIKNMFVAVAEKCKKEMAITSAVMPQLGDKIPRLKMREAQKIILERTERDHTKEPDLDPEDEKEICQWAKETHNSELLFITHYPTKKRPFYTFPDPEDPDYTLSFDILCRGLEITTGGQRINDYQQLLTNVKKWGNKPENFALYLQAFQYGMPPEGGFCLGAERLVKQILGLENLREANLFPRDMVRIDQRFSIKDNE
ncbi:aspartate--tRNA(Asn) ligase [bacterium (Candidatus Gribaldobacteria) CG08_land_8_20_14_0_20_39_15]|uniref:Aspartate--tRNA ligase n=1 Tax=bacterium (Candidatus Gribaldobacteria) CG08_land_8_20_14_0_20_39_15 TaxID=2014273 RepID=A0A2M6XUI9_9BACT|nr:MAG: aspartate--tRNA(Asn) ligase [bacterium (Candidatus Gribaldobacteria) CG08_land_8_20_14_0_20_39_15]